MSMYFIQTNQISLFNIQLSLHKFDFSGSILTLGFITEFDHLWKLGCPPFTY